MMYYKNDNLRKFQNIIHQIESGQHTMEIYERKGEEFLGESTLSESDILLYCSRGLQGGEVIKNGTYFTCRINNVLSRNPDARHFQISRINPSTNGV